MTYLLTLIKLTFSIPILLIQILLSLFFKIKIGKIDTGRIGNTYVADLYLIKKKIKKLNYNEIWVTDKEICNSQMYKMINHHFNILNFMKFYYDSINFLSSKFNLFSGYLVRLDFNKDSIYHGQLNNQMKLTAKDKIRAKFLAKNFNIPKKSKVICIACRDDSYLKKKYPGKNFSYHSYRDTNINSFIPIIKKLIKKKYFVIRVGREAKTRVKIRSKYFLDYPFCKYKNDLLDFYFANICSLWIGSNTGLDCLAHMFRKPSVIVNFAPVGVLRHNIYNKKLIYHFKSYIAKKNLKKLSFSKIFEKKLQMLGRTDDYRNKKILLKSATSKEITDICWEGLNYHIKKRRMSIIDKHNQKLLKRRINLLFKIKENNIRCIFSPIFLKKNKWIANS